MDVTLIETLTGKWSDQLEYIIFIIGKSSVNCHFFLAHWLHWKIHPWQERCDYEGMASGGRASLYMIEA